MNLLRLFQSLIEMCCVNIWSVLIKDNESNEKAMNKNWRNYKTNPTLKTKMGYNLKLQIDNIQWKQMANRAGSYFPKGGHSATQTELKVYWTNDRWNITETLTPKTGKTELHQNHRLGTVSNELLGGGGA